MLQLDMVTRRVMALDGGEEPKQVGRKKILDAPLRCPEFVVIATHNHSCPTEIVGADPEKRNGAW